MINDKLVSIIVPVYKVEKYLDRCLESLIKQTYSCIEIILVDDGSPDGCPEKCDEWAKQDERVKVIHKTNGGISDARNVGLDVCRGEYIAFVDSDDWVTSSYIEDFMKFASKNTIVCCGLTVTDGNYKITRCSKIITIISAYDFWNNLLDNILNREKDNEKGNYILGVWNKLYPVSVFKDLRFPTGINYEDAYISTELYNNNYQFIIVNKSNYYYFQRPDSIMKTNNKKNRLDMVKAWLQIEMGIKTISDTLLDKVQVILVINAYNTEMYGLLGYYDYNQSDYNYTKEIINTRTSCISNYNKIAGRKRSFKQWMLRKHTKLFVILYKAKTILRL